MLLQAKEIPVQLPTALVICDTLDRAEGWSKGAQLIQDGDKPPHFDKLKGMLASGRPIPVKLELLAQLESRFAAAKGWVDRAARTFQKKTSNNVLLDVSIIESIMYVCEAPYCFLNLSPFFFCDLSLSLSLSLSLYLSLSLSSLIKK